MKRIQSITSIFILSLLCFFSLETKSIYANYQVGEGRFYVADGDKLSFIKKQLLYSAFRKVITAELKRLNLDNELFWQTFDQSFEEYFSTIAQQMRAKYGLDRPNIKAKTKQAFNKALRKKRLTVKEQYGNLDGLISRYAIKKMSISSKDPNSRYIRVQAKINRKKLQQIYHRFLTKSGKRNFEGLFVTLNFRLEGMSWDDTGVAIAEHFTDVLKQGWEKSLRTSLGSEEVKIQFTDEVMEKELISFLKLSDDNKEGHIKGANGQKMSLNSSLWLKLDINLSKIAEHKSLDNRVFLVELDYLLQDLANKKIIDYQDFKPVEKTFSTKDAHQLSNYLVSVIYHIPEARFQGIAAKISTLRPLSKKVALKVSNYQQTDDLLDLKKMIAERGIMHHFFPTLEAMKKDYAIMNLEYLGDLQKVKQALMNMHNMVLKSGNRVIIRNDQDPFSLELVREKMN